MRFDLKSHLLRRSVVTLNKVSRGPSRYPEGCINAAFNFGHKVADGTFFNVVLLIVFDPEMSGGEKHSYQIQYS